VRRRTDHVCRHSEADRAEDQLAEVEDRREAEREADQEQLEQRLDRREEVAEATQSAVAPRHARALPAYQSRRRGEGADE
jgi:hypothetical protein